MVQALYVKRSTIRLPEPKGIRYGVSGSGPQTSILVVGDSSAAGVGVDTQDKALIGRLVASISESHEISWNLIAKTGDTSRKVLGRLEMAVKKPAEYVLLAIGVNDVTSLMNPKESIHNIEKAIAFLKTEFNANRILVSQIPPMHLFPALPQPLRWWLGIKAKKLNCELKIMTDNDEQCSFLEVALPFDKDYMAEDGFHPGGAAYELWGNYVAKVIRTELSNKQELK